MSKTIHINGLRLTVQTENDVVEADMLAERVEEIAPLLEALLRADSLWEDLDVRDQQKRHAAFLAMRMKCEAAIAAAVQRAELLCSIISGDERIGEYGFPEFDEQSPEIP